MSFHVYHAFHACLCIFACAMCICVMCGGHMFLGTYLLQCELCIVCVCCNACLLILWTRPPNCFQSLRPIDWSWPLPETSFHTAFATGRSRAEDIVKINYVMDIVHVG